jgi:hypothetical protein
MFQCSNLHCRLEHVFYDMEALAVSSTSLNSLYFIYSVTRSLMELSPS